MDIVTVKDRGSKASQRRKERRHTTEVHFNHLPSHTLSELERDTLTSFSTEDLSPRGESYHHPVADYPAKDSSHLVNGQFGFKNSWGNVGSSHTHGGSSEFDFKGSQGDVYKELTAGGDGNLGVAGHQYQLSYDLAMDNVLTPFAPPKPVTSPLASPPNKLARNAQKSHVNHVVQEMVATETTYEEDLSQVIEGYVMPLRMRTSILPYSSSQLDSLFGNIIQIRDFHSSFLAQLKEGAAHDIGELGQCFLSRADGFKSLYTQYCNNYPSSIRVLTDLSQQSNISRFLKTCQQRLGHPLPLGAYLLKPVQRVLKYSLLLSEIVKAVSENLPGFSLILTAQEKMEEVAEHINAMKKKYDAAVHVQELQSLVRGNESLDLTKFGELVLEDHFKYSSAKGSSSTFRGRTERHVFLFQHLYLVTKKDEVGYQYKMHVEMKDLQLTERVEKEPMSFQIRQVTSGRASTFQARTAQQKNEWVQKIKTLLIDSIPHLPNRAKQLIMGGFEVPRDPSPNRDLHRRGTEELKTSPLESIGKMDIKLSQSLGRNFSSQAMAELASSPGRHPKLRGRQMSSPTGKYSLTGLLVSSLHQPSSRSDSPHESDDVHHSFDSPELRDSGYSDSVTGEPHRLPREGEASRSPDDEPIRARTKRLYSLQPLRSTPDQDYYTPTHTPVRVESPAGTPTSRRSPAPMNGQTAELAENHAVGVTGQSYSDDFIPPPLQTNTTGARQSTNPFDHDSITSAHEHDQFEDGSTEHAQCMIPEEAETLFNELMDSTLERAMHTKTSSTDLDWGDASLRSQFVPDQPPDGLPSQLNDDGSKTLAVANGHHQVSSSVDTESSTPRASPYTSPSNIRRWSVRKRRSYDLSDPDDSTPKASPFITRHLATSAPHVPIEEPGSEDESAFVDPILDPPTPFRSPSSAEPHQPCLDKNLEQVEPASLEPPSCDHDIELPLPFQPQDREPSAKARAKTLPPNMTFEDLLSSTVGRIKAESANSIKRSRSFGNKTKIFHKRDGSFSTDNSPIPSPIFTKRTRGKDSKHVSPNPARHHSTSSNSRGSPAPTVSVVGLISTTRTAPELQDIPLIQVDATVKREGAFLPLPGELEISPERSDSRASTASREVGSGEREPFEKEEKSLRSFLRLKSKKSSSRSATPCDLALEDSRADLESSPSPVFSPAISSLATPMTNLATPTTVPAPSTTMTESYPNEMISFEDALETYDRYSAETGKTAGSCRREAVAEREALTPTLDTKKKSKKKNKKRHGYTVANIDSETMKEVKRLTGGGSDSIGRKTSDSKVHQLAREYSRKIKNRNSQLTRFSTVMEEDRPVQPMKPVWLTDLQEKRNRAGGQHSSLEDILNRVRDEDTSSTSSSLSNGEEILGAEEVRPTQRPTGIRKSHTMDGKSHRGLLFEGAEFKEKAGEEDGQKKRRFKGWVKSLAAKFGKKEGTTL